MIYRLLRSWRFLTAGTMGLWMVCQACQPVVTDQGAKPADRDTLIQVSEWRSGDSVQVHKWPAIKEWLRQGGDSVSVINFWASWCAPCLEEMPYLIAARRTYGDKPVRWLFVSLDFASDRRTKLEPLLERRAWNLPVVLLDEPDANSWIPGISTEWQGNLPATWVRQDNSIDTLIDRPFEKGEIEAILLNKLAR